MDTRIFKLIAAIIAVLFATATSTAQEAKTMYVMKNGEVLFQSAISDIDSIIFYAPPAYDAGVVINGVRWATRNVGAPGTFAATPESSGMFYQYSRNVGWSSTDPMINSNGGNTWNFVIPTASLWERVDDPSPAGWRAPSYEEIETLFDTDKVRYEWVKENGVYGGRFTDNATDNSIFLPGAGYRLDDSGSLVQVDRWGIYWSGTTRCGCTNARFMRFDSDELTWSTLNRRNGLSLRSVAE